jgi:hypothetical protein
MAVSSEVVLGKNLITGNGIEAIKERRGDLLAFIGWLGVIVHDIKDDGVRIAFVLADDASINKVLIHGPEITLERGNMAVCKVDRVAWPVEINDLFLVEGEET